MSYRASRNAGNHGQDEVAGFQPVIESYRSGELTVGQAEVLARFLHGIWPRKGDAVSERTEEIVSLDWPDALRLVIWKGDQPVGHAFTFGRRIIAFDGEQEVMALASVAVALEHRGAGLGERLVRRAFQRVDEGAFHVALFQTRVPGFYERLGARVVGNRFFDGSAQDSGSPWREPHVMVYPGDYDWPGGTIDLNGPGY